ncbi:hypothetical protein ACFO0N_06710 [Halobium salinum]|uniref:DUF7979 domain-containing protein n=1 Tax=Halobium salinum TaxID=1364940 RepID=A0ABD5P9S1_9EURY|nr:hypothetical protein [Halobium salinum]
MAGWKTFALLTLGILVGMAGVASWIAVADDDYKFDIKNERDEPPMQVTSIEPYASLSPEQQQVFDRAKAGETVRFETRAEYQMPRVVEQESTYYVSAAPRYFDWTDPRTFGPVLVALGGLALCIHAVRLDIRR